MPFLVAVAAMCTFLTIPRQPYLLDDSLSEKAVLSYAHDHDLQFGRDIVFSYGPLGFLTSRHFFPHAAGLRMMADVLLGFTVAAGVCLVAWRLTWFWRGLLIGVFVFLTANIDPRADLLLYLGLLCWGLLCVMETGRRLALCLAVFSAVAAFGVLVKANFLFVGGLSAVAITAELILYGQSRAAFGLVAGLVGWFLLGWVAAGQELAQMGAFFRNSLAVVQGYDQAVGFDGLAILTRRGVIVMVLAGAAAIIRVLGANAGCLEAVKKDRRPARQVVLLIWLGGLIFLIWKHGFVRADLYHMGFFFGFAPLLALALEIIPSAPGRAKLCARACALACCFVTVATLESYSFLGVKASLLQPFVAIIENTRALFGPNEYERQMREKLDSARQETCLPRERKIVGQSTVDVFGQEQFYAVFNGLNYHPRPVFQSYMAYNRTLARLNEDFYLSTLAPEFVLFELNPIDRKFPPLEDSQVLLHLLINYQLAESEGPFLLLRSNATISPELTLLREGMAKMGEHIFLNDYREADLWMELEPAPTWIGKAKQVLHKSQKLRLSIWRAPSEARLGKYGAPAPMLRTGFLASPLLLNTDQVRGFYLGQTSTRPAAYSLEADSGQEGYWRQQLRFRLYKIENLSKIRQQH